MLIVEDSAHTYEASRAELDFFPRHFRVSDYLVIGDGVGEFMLETSTGSMKTVRCGLSRRFPKHVRTNTAWTDSRATSSVSM